MPDRVVGIRTARQPHQVFILGVFLLYGLAAVPLYDRIATSSVRDFPEPWGRLLLAGLTVGSALVLFAAWRNNKDAVTRFERSGHYLLIILFTFYGGWSMLRNGLASAAFWGVLIGLAGASVWRLFQVHVDVRRALRVVTE